VQLAPELSGSGDGGILEVEGTREDLRHGSGADDETTRRNLEGDGEEDHLDGGGGDRRVSDRTMRRMKQRYEAFGYDGLFDQRRGKRSIHRVPLQTAEEVLALYQEKYFDFSVLHFHEKLRKEHDIKLSYSWVKAGAARRGLGGTTQEAREPPPAAVTPAAAGHAAAH
jgi:transposase